jgi:hypothetical protein
MNAMHIEEAKIENETKIVFRAMFLGIPVYSAEETNRVEMATADLTAVVSHREFVDTNATGQSKGEGR